MQSPPVNSMQYDINNRGSIIRLGEMDIQPASVDGGEEDVFSVSKFTLVKPRWVEDGSASVCKICQQNFTQLRRKHHCRFCGHVLCNKCCFQKVAMPQLGYTGAERVCEDCVPVAVSIKNTYAVDVVEKYEAVRALVAQLSDPNGTQRFLESGGLHVLIHMLRTKNVNLWSAICVGLLQLSTYVPIQPLVIKAGGIKAFRSWLLSGEPCPEEIQRDCISIMQMLCQTQPTRLQAISEGVLENALALCINGYGDNMLLALGTLCLLVEEQSTHDTIVNGNAVVISRIFSYVLSVDEQVQEVSLKILAHLSMGQDHVKHKLVQEDQTAGKCFLRVLQSRPSNVQVLCNASCAVANLAASFYVQTSIGDHLPALCELMGLYHAHRELMGHVARGMANFAANSVHGPLLMTHLSTVMARFLKSEHSELRYQGLKMVMRLVAHSWQSASSFYKEDVMEILRALAEKQEVMSAMDIALMQTVPGQVKPS